MFWQFRRFLYVLSLFVVFYFLLSSVLLGNSPLGTGHQGYVLSTSSSSSIPQREAYVTLLTSDNPNYLLGAVVLAHSIRTHDDSREVVVLHPPDVLTPSSLLIFEQLGVGVHQIEDVPEPFFSSETCPQFSSLQNNQRLRRWGRMFLKLRLWELPYTKVIFFDSDSLAYSALPSRVANLKELSAEQGKEGKHSGFNAGFLVLEPSNQTVARLHSRLAQGIRPTFFGNYLDCTEQAFFNEFFREFRPVVLDRPDREIDDRERNETLGVHWIGDFCPKPWKVVTERCQKRLTNHQLSDRCSPQPYLRWEQSLIDLDRLIQNVGGQHLFLWNRLKKKTGVHCL